MNAIEIGYTYFIIWDYFTDTEVKQIIDKIIKLCKPK